SVSPSAAMVLDTRRTRAGPHLKTRRSPVKRPPAMARENAAKPAATMPSCPSDSPCTALTAGMCGTQLASTTPLMKKIVDTAERERMAWGSTASDGLRSPVVGSGLSAAPRRLAQELALQERSQRLSGTMEPRLHRVRGDAQEGRCLVRVELLDVAQEEDAPVIRREAVDGLPD